MKGALGSSAPRGSIRAHDRLQICIHENNFMEIGSDAATKSSPQSVFPIICLCTACHRHSRMRNQANPKYAPSSVAEAVLALVTASLCGGRAWLPRIGAHAVMIAKKSMLAQIVVGYALHEYPTVTEAGRNVLCNKSTATNYSRILVSLVW